MRVLVADDSQPIRERLISRLLRIPDIQVAEAEDTPSAILQIETFKPDVAVLDIRMPGGGGIKALEIIKAKNPGITVIIMTNYPYAQYRRKCLDAGADFFFDKSSEFEQVSETIRQLMQQPGSAHEVAHHTAAAQLVQAKEVLEKVEQRQRDMSLLSLFHTNSDPAELKAAHAMWERTFDAIPDMVALFDAEHRIIRVNKAMADRLNLPAVELAGKPCYIYCHGTDHPIEGCPHEAMLHDGQNHSIEAYEERLGGWVQITVSPVLENGKLIGAIHITRDINQQRQAETYRKLGWEILQILNRPTSFDESIQCVLAAIKTGTGVDAAGIRLQDGDDFPYFVQDRFSEDFLLTENTLVERGADGGVFRNPDGSIRLECTCGLVLSGKTNPSSIFTRGGSFWVNDSFPLLDLPADQDPRLHTRNNCILQNYASVALVTIRSQDRIVGLIQLNDRRKGRFTLETVELLEGIAVHIGEAMSRKQAEQVIKENETRYRELFESMQSGFALHEIICDKNGVPCDYRFLEANKAFEALTGLKIENIVGRTVKDILPATEERWIEAYGRVALTGKPIQIEDFSTALGRHYSVSAYSPGKGQFATVFADITDQKNAEAIVLRARDAAEAASKAKSRFLANMSHELRTPLNAIIGLSEILQFEQLNEDQLDYVKTISASGEAMLALVVDLLDFSRIELGKIEIKNEAFNIRETVANAVSLLSHQAGSKGIELTSTVDDAVAETIVGDAARLQQVLVNLLTNALKFTEKGFVRLTVRERQTPSGSRRVEFSVEDSGEGMSEVVMKRIFEPFQQGDNSSTREHGGVGLGLAICKNLVEMMGGAIRVESRAGAGSLFTFHIQDQTASPTPVPSSEVRASWRGKCVCVWDDNPANLRTVESLLERCSIMPRYAESLESITDRLTKDDPADAVLCNLEMPGLAEKLSEFRALRPDLPWIAFSSWDTPLAESVKNCFSAFIDRPLKPDQLYGALMQITESKT